MPTSFYDVVILGTHSGPLVCAALLARRGLRVLVLGQGVLSPSYTLGGVEIERNRLIVTGIRSPAIQRVLDELAIQQDVRQRMPERERPFQLLLADRRVDLYDGDRWAGELAREAPEVRRQAIDITRTLGEVRDELDAIVRRDLTWPPETFIERQRFSFTTTGQRFDREGQGWTSWRQLPTRHPLRIAFEQSLAHLSGLLAWQHSDATRARLYGQILGDVTQLSGGSAWFHQALVSRIRSWGSDVRPRDRVQLIRRDGRRGHIIRLTRSEEEIGCTQIVHGTAIAELSQLASERASLASLFERVGEPRARAYRCSVHFLVASEGVPEALEPLGLICAGDTNDVSFLLGRRSVDQDRTLLTLCRLVEEHRLDAGSALDFVREEALDALRSVVPFLDRHLIWMDSPHDGLPPSVRRGDTELPCSDPWARGPQTMPAVYEYPTRRALGVCALPTRTPLRGVFLCNDQVAPGLGFEGSFLAAASVARLVESPYRRQDWLRRGRWPRRSA